MKKLLFIFLISAHGFTIYADNVAQALLKKAVVERDVAQIEELLQLGTDVPLELLEECLHQVNRTKKITMANMALCSLGALTSGMGAVISGIAASKAWEKFTYLRDTLFPWYKEVVYRKPEKKEERAIYFQMMKILGYDENNPLYVGKDVMKNIYGRVINKEDPFHPKEEWVASGVGPFREENFKFDHVKLTGNRLHDFKERFSKLENLGYFDEDVFEYKKGGLTAHNPNPQPLSTEPFFANPYYVLAESEKYQNDLNMLTNHEELAKKYLGERYSLRGGKNLSDYFNVLEFVAHQTDPDGVDTMRVYGKMMQVPALIGLGSIGLAGLCYWWHKKMKTEHLKLCEITQKLLLHNPMRIPNELKEKHARTLAYLKKVKTAH